MTNLLSRAKEFDLGSTAIFRLATLAAGFAANMFAIAIISRQHGSADYASFALVASLVNLLPFADLGMGASVVNATADRAAGRLTRSEYFRTVSKARDYMTVFTVFVASAAICTYAQGFYPSFLGSLASTKGISEGALFSFLCIASAIPLGLGQRVLQGLGKMKKVVQIGFVGPILQIALYLPLWLLAAPVEWYFIGPGMAYLATAFAGYLLARRKYGLRLNLPLAGFFRPSDHGQNLWHTAAPFLLISVGMSLAFQSHRLMLSAFGTVEDVANYSLVAQFLGPMLAVTTVVGQNLWAKYRRELHLSSLNTSTFTTHLLIFTLLGIVFALALTGILPAAAAILTGGSVSPGLGLVFSAGAYLLVTAIHQPSAMLLNDVKGLWLQSALVALVAVSTVAGSVMTIPLLGASAPYICMSSFMLILQVIPSIWMSRKRIVMSVRRPDEK